MQNKRLLEQLSAQAPNRRSFLSKIALATAAVGAVGGIDKAAAQSGTPGTPSDADILNFALNLEYLEAEFYTVATTGSTIDTMGIGITGSGNAGATTGGSLVNFTGTSTTGSTGGTGSGGTGSGGTGSGGTGSGGTGTGGTGTGTTATAQQMSLAIAQQIAADERAHVALIRNALMGAGATPIAKPAIKLNALGIGFGSLAEFLTLARAFEDVGVSAYAGAAPLIQSKTILGYAARIAQAEAEHAANLRLQVAQMGIATTALDSLDILPPPSGTKYFSMDSNGLTQTRTPGQVLYIVYGNQANVTSGGFFPNGVNGTLNMSSTAATPAQPSNGTLASVTPATMTTTQAQITLDASASTSGSGALMYLFMVAPGGKIPAILQSPTSSKATIQFVNGPGVYNLQLIVTDSAGNMSTTPIVLTYQPSTT